MGLPASHAITRAGVPGRASSVCAKMAGVAPLTGGIVDKPLSRVPNEHVRVHCVGGEHDVPAHVHGARIGSGGLCRPRAKKTGRRRPRGGGATRSVHAVCGGGLWASRSARFPRRPKPPSNRVGRRSGAMQRFRSSSPAGASRDPGATAAVNRGLLASGPFRSTTSAGSQRPWSWRGYEIFVTERGEGPPLLFVHGIYAGASSFEFRKIFAPLALSHKVIAFDLLGCGLSEMPVSSTLRTSSSSRSSTRWRADDEPLTLVARRSAGALPSVPPPACRAASPARRHRADGALGILDGSPGRGPTRVAALVRSPIAGEPSSTASSRGRRSDGSCASVVRGSPPR